MKEALLSQKTNESEHNESESKNNDRKQAASCLAGNCDGIQHSTHKELKQLKLNQQKDLRQVTALGDMFNGVCINTRVALVGAHRVLG